jgi:ABC-type amino acid transport substrate-binding protein
MSKIYGRRGNHMRFHYSKIALFSVIILLLAGCATSQTADRESSRANDELRVGVSTGYPPVIFEENGVAQGIEADLAKQLGKDLKLKIRLVKLDPEEQMPALTNGRTDIIMSGASITKAREVRVAFAEPYLKSGLIAVMRTGDAKKYASKESVLNGFVTVAAVKNTIGEVFVKKNFPNAVRKTFLPEGKDGVSELKRRTIDIFVIPAPAAIWLVSGNEADITGLWEPLTEDYLAWAIRKDDERLLMDVNAALERWKQDGTLTEILRKWLPEEYLKRMPLSAK